MADLPKFNPLVGDSLSPSGLVALTGYIGRAANPNHIRVYFDIEFTSYCEIAVSVFEASHKVMATNELAPSTIYLNGDTPIEVVTIHQPSVAASFLTGQIASTHLRGAARPLSAYFHKGGVTIHPFCLIPPIDVVCTLAKDCNTVIGCILHSTIKPEPPHDQVPCTQEKTCVATHLAFRTAC